jgi:hypothetical protein
VPHGVTLIGRLFDEASPGGGRPERASAADERPPALSAMTPPERRPAAASSGSPRERLLALPNPWDIGSACNPHCFRALATTSSGFAFSRGLPDSGAVTRDMALGHIAEIVAATELPVNADFQAGYAHEPEGVAESVRLCVGTGVAGLSIEDATGERERPSDLSLAAERIAAARAAIDARSPGVLSRRGRRFGGHPEPLAESTAACRPRGAGADVPAWRAPARRHRGDREGRGAETRQRWWPERGPSVGDLECWRTPRQRSALTRGLTGFIRAAKALAQDGASRASTAGCRTPSWTTSSSGPRRPR